MKLKQFLFSVGIGVTVGLTSTSALAGEITVASWGGAFQAAQSKAIFQPVAKAMGITINEESYNCCSYRTSRFGQPIIRYILRQ